MSRTSETLTISLPPQIAKAVKRTARQENKTKSELFRAALNLYLEEKERWQTIKLFSEKARKKLKIKNETDVEKLIDSLRK